MWPRSFTGWIRFVQQPCRQPHPRSTRRCCVNSINNSRLYEKKLPKYTKPKLVSSHTVYTFLLFCFNVCAFQESTAHMLHLLNADRDNMNAVDSLQLKMSFDAGNLVVVLKEIVKSQTEATLV